MLLATSPKAEKLIIVNLPKELNLTNYARKCTEIKPGEFNYTRKTAMEPYIQKKKKNSIQADFFYTWE